MEDPNLIAILLPLNDPAKHAFGHENNQTRYLPPTEGFNVGPVISNGEITPAYDLPQQDDEVRYKHMYRLLLSFEEAPKNPNKGYAFGTDKQKCDVVLGSSSVRGISGVHFHILFDVINGKRRLVLRDSSTNGTAVSYDGQAEDEVRCKFTWILNLEKDTPKGEEAKEWNMGVHVRRLDFKVKIVSHQTCEAKYNTNLTNFLNRIRSQNADPPLDGLNIAIPTIEMTFSQSHILRQHLIYVHEQILGMGASEHVNKVVDVSIGM